VKTEGSIADAGVCSIVDEEWVGLAASLDVGIVSSRACVVEVDREVNYATTSVEPKLTEL